MKKIFIDNIHQFFHFWTVRIDLFAVAFAGWLVAFPDGALTVWNSFPQDLKAMIPPNWTQYISVGLLVASIIARALRQNKLANGGKNESAS